MRADGCQRLWQPATSPAPRPMELVRCIRLGELRGLVPIPYVALQARDMALREISFLGHQSTLPASGPVPWVCQESAPPEPPKPRLFESAAPSRPATTAGAPRRRTSTGLGATSSSTASATPPRWVPALTITPPERIRYPAGARRISLPSGSGGVLHGSGKMIVHWLRRIQSP
jgi:outer membrane biosynthesis protein TonB